MSTRIAAFILFGLGVIVGVTNIAVTSLGGQSGWGPFLSAALLLGGVGLLAFERMRHRDG